MTLEITPPETEARIQRHLQSGQFHDLDDLLTKALDALPKPETAATPPERRTGQALVDAFAEIRGLLSDEEIDRMFSRNPSAARPVDLS
jgi:Arc/MetJ-type ribon-helix-helix transcriptional regulator